jgi:hypothetical protein
MICPAARKAKAQCHPTTPCKKGINQMVATVTAKPDASWMVRAVPTQDWSAVSVTIVENCAESATTEIPQTNPTRSTRYRFESNSSPISTAQVADMLIIKMVVLVLPQRSARRLPNQAPMPPEKKMAKVAYDVIEAALICWAANSSLQSDSPYFLFSTKIYLVRDWIWVNYLTSSLIAG